MLTFAPNLSTMFREVDFLQRFNLAKKAFFDNVELQFPYEYSPSDLAAARAGLKCTLFNSYVDGDMGIASIPGNEVKFLRELHNMTPYYNALGARRVHIMAGIQSPNFTFEDHLYTFKENLKSAVNYLENQDLVGVIEPICPEVKENYFLSSFDTAIEIINEIDSPHLKLLLDVYHLHKITSDVNKYLEIYFPYAGHIQVSQDPGRHEPFFPGGQIDYNYVFSFLEEKQYEEPIGLEYFPSGSTADSITWVKNYK